MDHEIEAALVLGGPELADGSLHQIEFAVVLQGVLRRIGNRQTVVERVDADILVIAHLQGAIGIAADGRAEDASTLELRERRNVGSSPCKAGGGWEGVRF